MEREATELKSRVERLAKRIRLLVMRLESDVGEAEACLTEALKLVSEVEGFLRRAGPDEADELSALMDSVLALKRSLAELCNLARRPKVLGE